jgi:hypothetical protein
MGVGNHRGRPAFKGGMGGEGSTVYTEHVLRRASEVAANLAALQAAAGLHAARVASQQQRHEQQQSQQQQQQQQQQQMQQQRQLRQQSMKQQQQEQQLELDGRCVRLDAPEGLVFELNNRVAHRVSNLGSAERIHLVVDVAEQPAPRTALAPGSVCHYSSARGMDCLGPGGEPVAP